MRTWVPDTGFRVFWVCFVLFLFVRFRCTHDNRKLMWQEWPSGWTWGKPGQELASPSAPEQQGVTSSMPSCCFSSAASYLFFSCYPPTPCLVMLSWPCGCCLWVLWAHSCLLSLQVFRVSSCHPNDLPFVFSKSSFQLDTLDGFFCYYLNYLDRVFHVSSLQRLAHEWAAFISNWLWWRRSGGRQIMRHRTF